MTKATRETPAARRARHEADHAAIARACVPPVPQHTPIPLARGKSISVLVAAYLRATLAHEESPTERTWAELNEAARHLADRTALITRTHA